MKQVKIISIEPTTFRTGTQGFVLTTSDGKFNLFRFNQGIIETAQKNVGNYVEIEVLEDGKGHKNITKMMTLEDHASALESITESVKAPRSDKDTYRVSELVCVKDIALALYAANVAIEDKEYLNIHTCFEIATNEIRKAKYKLGFEYLEGTE